LTWSSTNATSCTASGGWSGVKATSGSEAVTPTSTSTYTLDCTGAGGTVSKSTSVTVTNLPNSTKFKTGDTVKTTSAVNIRDAANGNILGTQALNATGVILGGGAYTGGYHWWNVDYTNAPDGWTAESFLVSYTAQPAVPTLSISASPSTITGGQSSTLTWSSTNATSCTASGGWSGTKAVSGTQIVSPTINTTYTLTCTGTGGTATQGTSVTVTSNPPPTTGTVYYLSPNGSDTNTGKTPQDPFLTFTKARNLMKPGDTLYLRGGTYSISTNTFGSSFGGTASAPVTIAAYPGETPIFTGSPQYGSFFSFNHSWYVLDGVTFQNFNASIPVSVSDVTNVTIKNSKFINNSAANANIRLIKGSYHKIQNNYFDTVGTIALASYGQGSHIYALGTEYSIIENNYFTKSGHAAIDLIEDRGASLKPSRFNVIRNNTIEQHWSGGIYLIMNSEYNLVENNTIAYAGEGITYPKSGIGISGPYNIVRRNIIRDTLATQSGGITVYAFQFGGIYQKASYNRIYNNIVTRSNRGAVYYNQKDNSTNTENKFVNNILYYNKLLGKTEQWVPALNQYLNFELYHAYATNKWASFPNNNYFFNNVFLHADTSGDLPGEPGMIHEDVTNNGQGASYTLTSAQTKYPTHFSGNVESNPQFVNFQGNDFHLKSGSPMIDAGRSLAQTTTSGTNTKIVSVDDALYFTDGYGIVTGDKIRIGTNPVVTVTDVNYSTNTITVSQDVTFSAGAKVNLDYKGSGPDIGVYEF
jgi:parallel beta-helix repeat protein